MDPTKIPNNKHQTCPALMSDGRLFTDYRPRCNSMESMLTRGMSSYDYRQFLINNAEKLMQDHRQTTVAVAGCESCDHPSSKEPKCMMTEEQTTVCGRSTCAINTTDVNGLGRGRTFEVAPNGDDMNTLPYQATQPTRGHLQSSRLGATPEESTDNFYPINGVFLR